MRLARKTIAAFLRERAARRAAAGATVRPPLNGLASQGALTCAGGWAVTMAAGPPVGSLASTVATGASLDDEDALAGADSADIPTIAFLPAARALLDPEVDAAGED